MSNAVKSSFTANSAEASLNPTSSAPLPAELEQTLNAISSHRNVRGILISLREGGLIRTSGGIFDGEHGRKYASAVKKIVDACQMGLDDAVEGGDELRFIRIRTKRHELMISPDEKYILVVLQDPSQ